MNSASQSEAKLRVSTDMSASSSPRMIAADAFTFAQLADIYNQSRVDYIVPMPMNARRMEDYIRHHDVALASSFVAFNDADEPLGIGMLGLRGARAWITRLGVIPARREKHVGLALMERLIDKARVQKAASIQLEVIEGNEPAYRLFHKLGFEELRRLLVIRRAPSPPPASETAQPIEPLTAAEIDSILDVRDLSGQPSWLDEAASLRLAGKMEGLRTVSETGASAFILFRAAVFQITHTLLWMPEVPPEARHDLTITLLAAAHARYPQYDTKIENLPLESPDWAAFQALGYVEAFRRIEMRLTL